MATENVIPAKAGIRFLSFMKSRWAAVTLIMVALHTASVATAEPDPQESDHLRARTLARLVLEDLTGEEYFREFQIRMLHDGNLTHWIQVFECWSGLYEVGLGQSTSWPGISGSVQAVSYSSIDVNSLLAEWGSVARSHQNSLGLAFVSNPSEGVPVVLGRAELLENAFPMGESKRESALGAEQIDWMELGPGVPPVLAVKVVTGSVGVSSAFGVTRVGFWVKGSRDLTPVGSIPLESYGRDGWEGEYWQRSTTRVEDVDGDGIAEFLVRRSTGFGRAWNTHYGDAGEIAYALFWRAPSDQNGRDSTIVQGSRILPVYLISAEGGRSRVRPLLPHLIFPPWDSLAFPATDEISRSRVTRLSGVAIERIPFLPVKREHNFDHQGPSQTTIPNAGIRMWIDGDSLAVSLDVQPTRDSDSPDGSPSTQYSALLLFDTDLQDDFLDRKCSEDDIALLIPGSVRDTSTWVFRYSLGEARDSTGPRLLDSLRAVAGVTGLSQYPTVRIPLRVVGLEETPSGVSLCGFGAELVNSAEFHTDHSRAGIGTSHEGLRRNDPTTWGNLAIGIRKDTVHAETR